MAPAPTGLLRYLMPANPLPGKKGEPKMSGGNSPAREPGEGPVVGEANREREVHRGVVHARRRHVHVRREGGVHVGDRVPAIRQVDAEGRIVLGVKLRRLFHQDRTGLRSDARVDVILFYGRRDVVERIDEVNDVVIAGREVPAHPALLDQHPERVAAAGVERRDCRPSSSTRRHPATPADGARRLRWHPSAGAGGRCRH